MLNHFFLLASVVAHTLATPIDHSHQKRQTVDCAPSSKTGLKPECWNQLDVEGFVNEWVKANGTAAGCDSLGFAQCFLQFNGFTGLTCNLITSDTCPPFATTDDSAYYSQAQFYALWNIYSIYQFFNQYSAALTAGSSLAGQTIDDIVATVAPPVESQAESNSLTSILGATLSVVTSVTGLIPGGTTQAGTLILNGLSTVFGVSTALQDQLLAPSQTANERFVQLGKIGSSLASLVEDYQANLLATVQKIQGDHTLFIAAATNGAFSQRVTTSLTVQASELFRQLQLFVLSQALQANGIVSSRSTGRNALDVAKQTNNIVCQSLTSAGNCFQWFIDSGAGNTYAFHNPNDWRNTQIDLTNAVVDNGWAKLEEVFKVEDCQGKSATFDAKTMGVTCLANHKFCEWNYFDSPVDSRANNQWKNCDNDELWGSLCGSFTNGINVPESYLGPLLLTDGLFCKIDL